ncbi:hypothetical protein LT85_p014 (plasmid) [Collimonas arenae]|uniref:Bacterial virulence protein VirB8 domain-containing protein n=2 Tax=Collimonas arenae TaxID=279058 RepID=A0A0A1FHE2_9BURK|nr:hypothetical protein LT85_p014 [Collimonas arenae]
MFRKNTFKDDPKTQQTQVGGVNKVKVERNRSNLFGAGCIIAIVSLGVAVAYLAANQKVIPVVSVLDANGHVIKQQVVTKETITGLESFVESDINTFITACNTFDPNWRQRNADLCRLHSTVSVAKQYDHETAADNPDNPYYKLQPGARRYPVITAINPLGDKRDAYQVEFKSVTKDKDGVETSEYYTAMIRNIYTFKPLALGDRWENPLGFASTSYSKSQRFSAQ